MKRRLHPPIEIIRSRLFDSEQTVFQASEETDIDLEPDSSAEHPMPLFLSELIDRKVAAERNNLNAPPAVGQIRLIFTSNAVDRDSSRIGQACAVMLYAHLTEKKWLAWLVTQETDYATDRDLIIEYEDGPIDPVAGMVLTWSKVSVAIENDAPILGKFSSLRLAAVIELSESPAGTCPVAPRPGHVFAWDLGEAFTVTTGTPLGLADDPRHAYQSLYRELVEEINAATQAESRQQVRKKDQIDLPNQGWFRGGKFLGVPGLAPASLTAGILIGALTFFAFQPTPETAPKDLELLKYRSITAECSNQPLLKVIFKPDAPLAEIIALLRRSETRLVDGPSEIGEMWLMPPTGKPAQEVVTQIESSRFVESVVAIALSQKGCKTSK